MFFTNRRPIRCLACLSLAATLIFSAVGPALAADKSEVTVSSGGLTGGVITFADLGAVTLDGTQQTTPTTWSFTDIVDARGTGAGWNQTLTLTQLKEYAAGLYVVSGKQLATSSLKVTTAPVVSLADASSSPVNTVTPVTNTTALDSGSPVKLTSAALDGGMGSYALTAITATLTIPASAFAKNYRTDATVSLNTGP